MKYQTIAMAGLLALLAACGSGFTLGQGTVTVLGLAPGQTILCTDQQALVQFAGSGFLSEHGLDVTIRWTALSGTPFEGGTSATTETSGTVLTDSLFQCQLPEVFGSFPVLVTLILPGGNEGTSPPVALEIGGQLGPPDAVDDMYGTVGNVPLTVPAGTGVLFNDQDGECTPGEVEEEKIRFGGSRGATTGAVVAYDATTTLGGSVLMQPDGSFVYRPPLGAGLPLEAISGLTDTFTYTLEQNGEQDVATVSIDICETVWFIDDTVPPGGNGQMDDPFSSLAEFMAVQIASGPMDPEEGDWIFVYRGNSGNQPYDDGIELKAFQKLIGQGVDLVVCGQTLVSATERPVLTNSGIAIGESIGGAVIVLGDGNVVRGLTTTEGSLGIEGRFVTGPTLIDEVDIRDPLDSGILLDSVTGDFQIGDPNNNGLPVNVEITGGGGDGIQIGGQQITVSATALAGNGPNVSVYGTDIADFLTNGIFCVDANLSCNLVIIDDVDSGVVFRTLGQGPGACGLDLINSNIGLTDVARFRGVEIQNFGADIDANVSFNQMSCLEPCIYAEAQAGPGITLSWDFNNLTTGFQDDGGVFPTVDLRGIEGGITVTSMENNEIEGAGFATGIRADACIFDADPSTMLIDTVPGGTLVMGGLGARIEGTSLQLLNCIGALDFGAVTIFQQGGDSSGVNNAGGGLTLTFTPAPVVDHVP